jgi:cystathionine gamma-lyase
LAALENAEFGLAFSSGMGATDAVMKLLLPGDEVITGNDCMAVRTGFLQKFC